MIEFDTKEYFSESFGVIASDEYDTVKVRIKVYDKQAAYIRSLPLHHSQVETQTGIPNQHRTYS